MLVECPIEVSSQTAASYFMGLSFVIHPPGEDRNIYEPLRPLNTRIDSHFLIY